MSNEITTNDNTEPTIEVVTEIPTDTESAKLNLTFAKLNVQWVINKSKTDKTTNYFDRIQFAKFKLEEASGQKVKLNIKRGR